MPRVPKVFLLAPSDDHEGIIGHRALQLEGFAIGAVIQISISSLVVRIAGTRVNRTDELVRFRR